MAHASSLARRVRMSSRIATLRPIHKAVGGTGARLGSVTRLIIDNAALKIGFKQNAGRRNPILELRGACLKPGFADRAESLLIATGEGVEYHAIEVLVDDKMRHTTRSYDRDFCVRLPG